MPKTSEKLDVKALHKGNWHLKTAAIALNPEYRDDYEERKEKAEASGVKNWSPQTVSDILLTRKVMPGFLSKWHLSVCIDPDTPFTQNRIAIERPVIEFIKPPVEPEEDPLSPSIIGRVRIGKDAERELMSLWMEYTPQQSPHEKAHLNVAVMQVDMDRTYRELESAFRKKIREWKRLYWGTHEELLGYPKSKAEREHPVKDKEALIAFWLHRYLGYGREQVIKAIWPREAMREQRSTIKNPTAEKILSGDKREEYFRHLESLTSKGVPLDQAHYQLEERFGLEHPDPKRSKVVKKLYDRLTRAREIINQYSPVRVDKE